MKRTTSANAAKITEESEKNQGGNCQILEPEKEERQIKAK